MTMAVFPTAAHLVSWAKFALIDKQSAGRAKIASTGKGNPWLAGTLGEIIAGLARADTFLSERYRRLARRRGKNAPSSPSADLIRQLVHLTGQQVALTPGPDQPAAA
ncbi:hypothetical protein ONA70_17500 [Micromonospora yasonensis]|uniref:hypothetical protein n=1 Tax=Micromonospora yasonensis TaxID=1128667 RepID=UPI00222F1F7E|nr:hypothetical protein [Micromonospora yasonensis]MCW3841897.1 hypothetical protein [Micromonospora yasonensis]